MGRTPIRAKLVLDTEARSRLETIAKSRTEGQARIERILNRALEMGALASLEDRPGRGRKPEWILDGHDVLPRSYLPAHP